MKAKKETKTNAQMSALEIERKAGEQLFKWQRSKRFKRSAMIWAMDEDNTFAFCPIYPETGKHPMLRFICNLAESFAQTDFLDNFLNLARWTIQFKREKMQKDSGIDVSTFKTFRKAEKAILDVEMLLYKLNNRKPEEPDPENA